jgi:hypothetical protein
MFGVSQTADYLLLMDVASSNLSGGPVLGYRLSYRVTFVTFNDIAKGGYDAARAL